METPRRKIRPENPRLWHGYFPKITNSAKKQARDSTPALDDERYAWCPYDPDPQWDSKPDSDPRANIRTHQTDKMDSALITDQRTIRPTQNAAGAPRSKTEADTNLLRGVSTAEPEDALRVRPQRTPNRQKLRPA